jgi:hypothetical protein
MIASFVSHFNSTSLDEIERWPPAKLLAYFDTAADLRRILKGS